MLIMLQLTAALGDHWLRFSALRLSCSRRSVCAHSLRRLGGEGPPLKVATQTANLRVNGHFLIGLAVGHAWLAGQSCLRLPFSVFLALGVN